MNTHADKTQEDRSQLVSNGESQVRSSGESTFQFVDNRPEAIAQRKAQGMAIHSPRAVQLRAFQDMANSDVQQNKGVIQRTGPNDLAYAEAANCHFGEHLDAWSYYHPDITTEAHVRAIAQTIFASIADQYEWVASYGNAVFEGEYEESRVRLVWSMEGQGVVTCFPIETRSETADRLANQG